MSDRLAIAAAASVLMMSAFVLFGQATARAPVDPAAMDDARSIGMDSLPEAPLRLLLPR